MKQKIKYTLLISYLSVFFIQAQEKLGIANSNYSSINSIFLNPSSSVDSRTYMQLNLLGTNAFVATNMAYVPNFKVWPLIGGSVPADPIMVEAKGKPYLVANASAEGPSYVISKMEYGAGIFIRARSVANTKGIPYDVAVLLADPNSDLQTDRPSKIELKNVSLRNMTWAEYGLNFGKMFRKEPNELIALSANVKYLTGININYKMISELNAVWADSLYAIDALSVKDRYNDPAWNTGKGFGMDLGFTYKKMLKNINNYYSHTQRSNCNYIDYKYKLGFSLLDLGFIKFNKNTYRLDVDTTSYKSMEGLNLSSDFQSFYIQNKPIWATTPSAVALQLDYNFENRVYLNLTVIKNLIPDQVVGVQGSNLICLSPRYETKNFEFSMPFTLQRFKYPHLGVAFRFRTFVFGVDNVIPFVVTSNINKFGVYFNLGFSLFKNQACNTTRKSVDDCKPGLKGKQGNMISRIGKYMHLKRRTKK